MTIDQESASLYRITQWPLDKKPELLDQYPAFKLGVSESVRYYARQLFPLVNSIVSNEPETDRWIMTGPALASNTPAGANLLCRELYSFLNDEKIPLFDIKYDNESTAAIDYAKLDFADRVSERERLDRRLVNDPAFRDHSILFVNDICVTGAQQEAMQQYFERNGAAKIRWLYVVEVDPEIGKSQPRIEWHINFAPFEELIRLVSAEEIEFTGKCVLRLMHLSLAELDQVLQSLDEQRRARLLELALLNGFQHLPGFNEQLELVRSYSQNTNTVASG